MPLFDYLSSAANAAKSATRTAWANMPSISSRIFGETAAQVPVAEEVPADESRWTYFGQDEEETYDADEAQAHAFDEFAPEEEAEHEPSLQETIDEAFETARTRPAPTFIQKLLKRVKGITGKIRANMNLNPMRNLASNFAGWFGGETGTLLRALGVKAKALSTAFHTFKAVEAGISLVGVVIEAARVIVENIVNAVKGFFGAVAYLFTGATKAVAEIFTPERTAQGNADQSTEENDYTNTLLAGATALVGLGALLLNRDKLEPIQAKATGIAGAMFEGATKCATEGLEYTKGLVQESSELRMFRNHMKKAQKGFGDLLEKASNFNADDAARMFKRSVRQGRRPQ